MTMEVLRQVSPAMAGVTIAVAVAVVVRTLHRYRQREATPWTKVVSWAVPLMLVAAFSLPTFVLQYRLDDTHLTIRTVTGQEQVLYGDIRSAAPLDYTLGTRVFGPSGLAYHVGHFNVADLGPVRVFAGTSSGSGVLIETIDGDKVLLSPRDPGQFLAALERHLPERD